MWRSGMIMRSLLAAPLVMGSLTLSMGSLGAQADLTRELFSGLKFRRVGPVGNRISAVVGVPGDRNVYYAGAASGGVFKTEDGGASWQAIFDEQPAQSIGAIAIAPSEEIEVTRKQLDDLLSRLAEKSQTGEMQEAILSLGQELRDVEGHFFDLRLTGPPQDILWWPRRLYSKMTILLRVIQQSDFRPTDQQLQVYELYKTELESVQEEWGRLRLEGIADLNRRGLAVLGK